MINELLCFGCPVMESVSEASASYDPKSALSTLEIVVGL